MAVLPLLTRLYEPSDFALLAIYTSLIGLFVVVACGRFDLAIPLPESESDGLSLLILSLVIAAVFSFVLALIYWIWGRVFTYYFLFNGVPALRLARAPRNIFGGL